MLRRSSFMLSSAWNGSSASLTDERFGKRLRQFDVDALAVDVERAACRGTRRPLSTPRSRTRASGVASRPCGEAAAAAARPRRASAGSGGASASSDSIRCVMIRPVLERLVAPRFQIGLDRPDRLLVHDALERRHVHRAVARPAAAHGGEVEVVDFLDASDFSCRCPSAPRSRCRACAGRARCRRRSLPGRGSARSSGCRRRCRS